MFDWLRKAAQGVGNFIYNSTPVGGAIRAVNRAQRDPRLQQQVQQAQRAVQQVQRQIPQPPPVPKINLPKISLTQANNILGSLGKFSSGFSQGFQQPVKQGLQNLRTIQPQNIASQYSKFTPVDVGLSIIKPSHAFSPITKELERASFEAAKRNPNAVNAYKKVYGIDLRNTNQNAAIKDAVPNVIGKGTRWIPKPVKGVTDFVGENIVRPTYNSASDLSRLNAQGATELGYTPDLKGGAKLGTDLINVGSLAYTGALGKQFAQAGLKEAPKLALRLAPRLAATGTGTNLLNQVAQGKKLNELNLGEAALSGAAYTGLGLGIPVVGKGIGKGISKLLGKTKVDLHAPITVKTLAEKGKLLNDGYTNVKVKFDAPTHSVDVKNNGIIRELAPKGVKGVKIDKSTQEAVDAGALSPKLAQQGYKVTPDLEIIAPNGKKLSIGEIQQLEQASALTKAEQKIAQGQETYGEAEALTKQLGKQPARIADDFNQPRSPNGRYGSKEFNPELEQLKAYQTEQLQVLQRANQSSPEYRGAMDNYNVAQKRIDVLEQPKVTADTSTTLYETVPKGTFDKRPKGKIEEARSYIENALAKNLKQYHKEFGGVAKLARESDVGGGMDYSRQSMNPKWYRKFYEDNGRAPTKQDYLEIARSELKKGSPDARAMLGDDVVDTYVRSFEPPKPNRVYKQPKNVEKKRGFVQTVQDSEFTEQPTRVMLDQSDTFTTKSNKLLEKKANEMITADVTNARAYAMNNTDDQAVATAGQLIKYYQAKKDFGAAAQIADDVAHRLTEAGRTIQAASLYNKLNPEGILQYASSKVQKAGKTLDPQAAEVLTDLAKKIEKMADGEDKQLAIKEMMDIIGKAKGSAISDKIITLWKSGLLTSPVTTAGNLTSNTFKQIVKKASDDPIAAVTDMMFSVVTGKRTKTFTGRGLLGGAGEGSARGIKYFKTGYDIRNPIDKLDSKQVYFSDSWAGKVAQTYSDSVFRLMGAQDQPYFYAALRNTLYDQALAAAKNQGVKGQARDQFIKKFVNNTPSDIMDVATEEARQAVFQNKTMLSSIASKINQSDNTAVRALGQFLMPFSKVPSAVATEIFDRTPLGAAKEIVKQVAKRKFDQRAMSNAIAKSTTGTVGIMGLGYALDRGDSINLAFPQSETERNLWELEGRQPFSVKVGDKWVSLNYVQPFGSLIAMGAQYHRSLKDGGGVQDALASSAAMGAKAVTEQSFLRGVGGALGALQDPARQAERYVEQTAGSVIPNFIRTTARATDPVQRQINNAGEAVIAGVPGLRQTLLPKQNVFGQEIARADSPLGTMINPFRPTTAKSDPTIEELRRLYDTKNGVLPSELDKSAFGKDKQITPAQINKLQASVGQPVLERWQKIMADYRYKRLSDEDKAKVLKDARDAVSRGEKYAFAQDNGLGDTKLDKDSVRYLEGNDKDYLARDLPKRKSAKASSKPKRVAKAKKGRKAKVGRIAKSSAPKLRSIKLSAGKVPKISRTAKVKFRRYA